LATRQHFLAGRSPSPHYRFHSATYQIQLLKTYDDMVPFAQDTRAVAASQLLQLWKEKSNSYDAYQWIDELGGVVMQHPDASSPVIRVVDLPTPNVGS
jgi:hypothetical protein